MCKSRTKFRPVYPCPKRMAAQDFVAKTSAKAKADSAETARVRPSIGIMLQDFPNYEPKPGLFNLTRSSF